MLVSSNKYHDKNRIIKNWTQQCTHSLNITKNALRFGGQKLYIMQGLKQKKKILSLNFFFPGGGLVAGVDRVAGLFNKNKNKKIIISMIFHETNA